MRRHLRFVNAVRSARGGARGRVIARGALALTVVLGLVLALGGAAAALTLAAMSLEELTGQATLVVRARCIDRQVTRTDGRIESLARFAVLEQAKGDAPEVITVRQLGGRSDDLETVVPGAPLSETGDDVVLFLEPKDGDTLGVVGLALGYMPVVMLPGTGAAVRTSRTLGGDFAAGGVRPVAELLDRVRAIVARGNP